MKKQNCSRSRSDAPDFQDSGLRSLNAENVIAGFEDRVDQMFRAESGKPLVRARKRKPLGPERGNYVRHYSWSILEFAARCMYLGQMVEEANAALVENARHYLDNPKDINDRDSFHWHAGMVLRLIEHYGSAGSLSAGRLTPETETAVCKPIWKYARRFSKLAHADHTVSQTWHIYESENHHAMSFSLCWHFAKLAACLPAYREQKYDDGTSAAEHYRAWSEYFAAYCRERARKGMFIEMQNDGYNNCLIKGIYSFYDFGGPNVRRAAGRLLDLYWAYWAQEQLNGVQGGGRSRIYFQNGLLHSRSGKAPPPVWFYFGIGGPCKPRCQSLHAAFSSYRPPPVIADIALDIQGRGTYEVRQRPLGLARAQGMHPYRVNTQEGDILRYTYCDPAFIIGTPMNRPRPLEDWTAISAQNRWQGVIFAGAYNARIVPLVRPEDNRVAMNTVYSVQSKGSLLTQKLKYHRGGAEMIIWISEEGLSVPVEEDGIVFVEAPGAYAAVSVLSGGWQWKDLDLPTRGPDQSTVPIVEGRVMIPDREYAPVILQVMAKTKIKGSAAFRDRVKGCEVSTEGTSIICGTVYGERLTLDTDNEQIPRINGEQVSFAPEHAFESPFLNGEWNSGIITVSKGEQHISLEFE